MIDELRMAELLCTRLCHDLTGPIGAVHNGAEFLSEEGFNLQPQAVELIVSSAFSAVSRLQFYRMAYGRVKDHGEASLSDKQKMAADFFADSKVTLDWPDEYTDASGISISTKMIRLIFNLLIISSSALLKGGTVAVKMELMDDGAKKIQVNASGSAIKWDAEADSVVINGADMASLSPKNVQYYLTHRLAGELNVALSVSAMPEAIAFTAIQPVKAVDEIL